MMRLARRGKLQAGIFPRLCLLLVRVANLSSFLSFTNRVNDTVLGRADSGCRACKARKIKCDEARPKCQQCIRNGEAVCDYSIRLNWEGRFKRKEPSTPEPGESSGSTSKETPQCRSTRTSLILHPGGRTTASSPSNPDATFARAEASRASTAFYSRPPVPGSESSFSYTSASGSSHEVGSIGVPEERSAFIPTTMLPLPQVSLGQASAFDPSVLALGSVRQGMQPWPAATPPPAGYEGQRTTTESARGTSAPHYATSNVMSTHPRLAVAPVASGSLGVGESGWMGIPVSSSASSVTSEERSAHSRTSPLLPSNILGSRRLSVNSLLTQEESNAEQAFEYFGLDRGYPDRDIPSNDDAHALDPAALAPGQIQPSDEPSSPTTAFGFGQTGADSLRSQHCYAEPLQVKIPAAFQPLPPLLFENPMNLLYFHYFIEYTARILVPHDCPANPFRIILPQSMNNATGACATANGHAVALRDETLLKLLLAYSASHRARMLGHPLPSNRIAVWVSEVFPNLRRVFERPPEQIAVANVATAIMLASLEIIAPSTFGVGVVWQDHLRVARRVILAHGGARAVESRGNRIAHFLVRWFAYLDVLGSFYAPSTGPTARTESIFAADLYDFGRENDHQIDCLLGFSGRLAGLLAAISDLARACDARRAQFADPARWRPDAATVARARQIQAELEAVRGQARTFCPHRRSSASSISPVSATSAEGQAAAWEAMEMAATNEAFHAAGLLHLLRRVLGRSRVDAEVQHEVGAIAGALGRVRRGGCAEACLLFPVFTAGCEAIDDVKRGIFLDRVRSMEESGMTQVSYLCLVSRVLSPVRRG